MGGIVGLLGAGLLAAGPALAHPHVWIDTRIEVILDAENQATGLRISWTYDDLYSLYIIGDKGLDPDWDGALTPEEVAHIKQVMYRAIEKQKEAQARMSAEQQKERVPANLFALPVHMCVTPQPFRTATA